MNKKKLFVIALAICVAATVSMGSLAWFSAQDRVTNNFLIADSTDNTPDQIFSIDVFELYDSDGVDGDERYDGGITYNEILPGDTLPKNAIVKNTGHYDQFVRVIITISDRAVWEDMITDAGYDFDTYDIRQHLVDFDSTKWDLVNSTMSNDGEVIQYVLYMNGTLASDQQFSVFKGIEIPEFMTQEHAANFDNDGEWGFTIGVKAQAVQTRNVGSNAAAAFATVGMSY